MVRNVLSCVALATLLAVQAQAAGAQTTPVRSSAKPAPTAVVNINTATASDLVALPGIGTKTATRIIEYRQKNGPFKKIEELMNVRGVGEKNFLKLKPQITVATVRAERTAQQ
jgi:competence protein ComEA